MKRHAIGRTMLARVVLFVAAVLGLAAAAALVIQFRIRLANQWQQYSFIDCVPGPTGKERIVVFAPHCDDETLGCGGLLALAARGGAAVRVVLITNGDSYRLAAGAHFKTVSVTPEKSVKFAYTRQAETLRALGLLGIKPSRVTFLGYPDRGIARLWDKHWSQQYPYTSAATRQHRSPYRNSRTLGAVYCGESLIQDIESVLREEAPTDVYMPHPADNHSDHYATYCFVTAAVEQLRERDPQLADRIKLHTYLVHRGDWPTPRGYHPKTVLAPPYALVGTGTKWHALELPPDVAQLKLKAIREHKTQIALEPGFLMSFARSNEIIGDLPIRKVVRVPQNTIKVDGSPEDWSGIPPCVIDPVGDYLVANVTRGGDVRAIYACADNSQVYFRIDCVVKLSRPLVYLLAFRGIGSTTATDHLELAVRPSSQSVCGSAVVTCRNNVMELALPRRDFSFSRDIYIRVTTRFVKLTVDNTGWHAVQFARK